MSRDTLVWSSRVRVSTPAGARGGLSFGGQGKGRGAPPAGTQQGEGARCWDAAALEAERGLDMVGLAEVRRLLLQLDESETSTKQKLKAREQERRRPRFEDEAIGVGMA